MEINQYPLESLSFQDEDFYDIDFWTGSGYQTKKILGSTIKAGILSGVVNVNIYNSDGSLTGDRNVTLDGGNLILKTNSNDQTIFEGFKTTIYSSLASGEDAGLVISSPNDMERYIELQNNGLKRWKIRTFNNELGSNTGSDLLFQSYDDIGAPIGEVLKLTREGGIRILASYNLPNTDGTNGQVMTTDGAGNVTFETPSSATNIYNSDGTLTGNRVVSLVNNDLTFSGSGSERFQVNIDDGTNAVVIDLANAFGVALSASSPGGASLLQITTAGININGQYNLPNNDGTIGNVLTTNGAGVTSWQPVGGALGAENYITASTQWSKTLTAPQTLNNGEIANGFTFFDNFLDKVANGTTPYYEFNIDFGISITLSGTSGTANINVNGVNYLATFNTSLYQTAVDWVSLNQSTLNALGIVVFALGSGADGRIRFGSSNEALLNAISITNVTTNLSGVLANEFTGLPTAANDHVRVQYNGEPIDGQRLLHTIRANFNITIGSVQYAELRLYRYQNDSIIGSGVSIQRNPDESGQQVVIETYTGSSSDAFVTGGFYIAVANNTGTSLEFTGASGILIQSVFQKPTLF